MNTNHSWKSQRHLTRNERACLRIQSSFLEAPSVDMRHTGERSPLMTRLSESGLQQWNTKARRSWTRGVENRVHVGEEGAEAEEFSHVTNVSLRPHYTKMSNSVNCDKIPLKRCEKLFVQETPTGMTAESKSLPPQCSGY